MMDQTTAYRVQTERWALDPNVGMACVGFQGRRRGRGGMGLGRGRKQLIFYNYEGLGHYSYDYMNDESIMFILYPISSRDRGFPYIDGDFVW